MSTQPRLFVEPMVALMPVDMATANDLLIRWGHRLGTVNRPSRQEAFVLESHGRAVSLATSGIIMSNEVAGYQREEVIELSRLCTDPAESWATRVMLRLWRTHCAPAWSCWEVHAAVFYSQNSQHKGDVYRFDGWEKIREDAGMTSPRGTSPKTRNRYATPEALGKKTLWLWRYTEPTTTRFHSRGPAVIEQGALR